MSKAGAGRVVMTDNFARRCNHLQTRELAKQDVYESDQRHGNTATPRENVVNGFGSVSRSEFASLDLRARKTTVSDPRRRIFLGHGMLLPVCATKCSGFHRGTAENLTASAARNSQML